MKLGDSHIDATDRRILAALQEDCKAPLAQVGKRVGLSAPSVMERIRKMEQAGVIVGYHGVLDSRAVGLDVTAFIGVSITPAGLDSFEAHLPTLPNVMECHHVTGAYTLLLKIKTENTQGLEELISRLRLIEGVSRTETLVVLSTRMERTQVPLGELSAGLGRKGGDRKPRARQAAHPSTHDSIGSGPGEAGDRVRRSDHVHHLEGESGA